MATRENAAEGGRKQTHRCRFCDADLPRVVVDLKMSPLANSYLTGDERDEKEPVYPLRAFVCAECYLMQLEDFGDPAEIFSQYAYFSSYSDSWLRHARSYVDMAMSRFALTAASQVVEIASNDGYLLQYFVERGIPVLGIEPAGNVAEEAIARGVTTRVEFFTLESARRLAAEGVRPDLIVGNNVLAHVPRLNDFVAGLKALLGPAGVVTMEFPHVLRLIEGNQFDTIYHEHFSYFSLLSSQRVFATHGLTIFDVDELATHGGSLRIYARHTADTTKPVEPGVAALIEAEITAGLQDITYYERFGQRVEQTKKKLVEFLDGVKRQGKSVVGYGAPAKGNTLLNYCNIGCDVIDYTVDRSPHKQGRFLPGSHIAILHPDRIQETQPDYLLILPWNLKDEIIAQMAHVRDWGGKFVVPIPEVTVFS